MFRIERGSPAFFLEPGCPQPEYSVPFIFVYGLSVFIFQAGLFSRFITMDRLSRKMKKDAAAWAPQIHVIFPQAPSMGKISAASNHFTSSENFNQCSGAKIRGAFVLKHKSIPCFQTQPAITCLTLFYRNLKFPVLRHPSLQNTPSFLQPWGYSRFQNRFISTKRFISALPRSRRPPPPRKRRGGRCARMDGCGNADARHCAARRFPCRE